METFKMFELSPPPALTEVTGGDSKMLVRGYGGISGAGWRVDVYRQNSGPEGALGAGPVNPDGSFLFEANYPSLRQYKGQSLTVQAQFVDGAGKTSYWSNPMQVYTH